MKRERTFACEDCGQITTRRRATTDPLVCLECGIARAVATARAQAAEAADRWDISAYIRTHPESRIATLIREG